MDKFLSRKLIVALAYPLFLLAGCGSIAKEYVSADELTMNAVSPEFRRYVENDAALDDDAKALRYATLDSWSYRVQQAKKAAK